MRSRVLFSLAMHAPPLSMRAGNLMVFTAGQYRTADFVKVGVFLQVGRAS